MDAPQALKAWREARGLKLEPAGKLIDVSAVTWRAWEMGEHRPNKGVLREALEALTGIPAAAWQDDEDRALLEKARAAGQPAASGEAA
jgi:transcriptional regulator with XRE-family HTH domain